MLQRPCLRRYFLDECDTLARSRLDRNDVGETSRITNALLEMLESFRGEGLIIAATNLDSALDSALIRRFDEVLRIPLPSIKEIERILSTTLSALPLTKGIRLDYLAMEMDGMSCSDVSQIGQNAAKNSVLDGRNKVSEEDIKFALAEVHERHSQTF